MACAVNGRKQDAPENALGMVLRSKPGRFHIIGVEELIVEPHRTYLNKTTEVVVRNMSRYDHGVGLEPVGNLPTVSVTPHHNQHSAELRCSQPADTTSVGDKLNATSHEIGPYPHPRICGLQPTAFWLAFALAVVVVATGIGAGIAVAMINKRTISGSTSTKTIDSASQSLSTTVVAVPTSVQTITVGTGPTATATTTLSSSPSSSPTTSLGPGGVQVSCPGDDNTIYNPPNTTQKFQRHCNTNYYGYDIGTAQTQNIDQCINLCAKYNEDSNAASRCVALSMKLLLLSPL
ncbi:hypothetical protein BGZ60DRAFT_438355 [Tricladium varicosporioides]|nr:hypothetical protein BGZ60DRAFT_438355 [Hymenoscyphus varicosporioides]